MMAYRKVDDGQGRPLGGEVLQCSEGLGGLDWSLDKEGDLQEPEPGLVRMQLQHAEHQRTGCTNPSPDPDLMEPIQPSVSVSPHGRFERLQEDPDYISHFTRCPGHKGQRRLHCTLARYLLAGACFFVAGLLIGRFTRSPDSGPLALPADSKDLLEDLLKGITADKIKTLQRALSSLPDAGVGEEVWARFLYRQWVGLGLRDVRLSNHTVLLSLPGPAPNTITDGSINQCFLPCGTPCDQPGGSYVPRPEPSYAAYSAVGSLEAEVVDVEYGTADRLRRASGNVNLTGRIALVKLGQAPLLYKMSLLSEWGLGGALLYVDPCDAPPDRDVLHQAFSVTLNPGGHPLSPGAPSGFHASRGVGGSLTSLLVQPISASLAKRLLSSPPSQEGGGACIPLATPPHAERKKVILTIGNQWSHNKIYNLVGHLRGRRNSDRHVLVGSHHDSSQGGGASAIMTQLISTMMEQTKGGWAPDRTTVFCSWGGSALGHIGSLQWGQEHRVVLQSSAVSYVSLNSPVRGTERLRATASPALLQLTSDIQRRQLLSCMRGGNCPGPNVSSSQLPGDVSFFANQLAVPTVEFAFEQSKDEETTTYLSEVQFAVEPPETLDPLYKFHETIAKMTAEAIFRLVNDPVLPFYPLDVALDVQNKLKAVSMHPALLSWASSLRDRAAFLQSETMRPANDPKEREPSHVRMLNDVLRDLEKSFVVPHAPPGVYRNLLYSLPGKTPQFSMLRFPQEDTGTAEGTQRSTAVVQEAPSQHGAYDNQSLSLILAAVRSAEMLVCFGLGLFDDTNTGDGK